jgi:hypothetical protein
MWLKFPSLVILEVRVEPDPHLRFLVTDKFLFPQPPIGPILLSRSYFSPIRVDRLINVLLIILNYRETIIPLNKNLQLLIIINIFII